MMNTVQVAKVIECFATEVGADAFGIVEVENGVLSGSEADALVF